MKLLSLFPTAAVLVVSVPHTMLVTMFTYFVLLGNEATAFLLPTNTHMVTILAHQSRLVELPGAFINDKKNRQYHRGYWAGPLEACRSPSLSRVSEDNQVALNALRSLEGRVQADANDYFDGEFRARMVTALERARITDARFVNFNIETKVEFSEELSVEAITNVLVAAISSFGAASGENGAGVSAATASSPEALESYADLVVSIGESVKTSGEGTSAYNFSFERLGPGMFAFISASSSNIEDNETFGTQVITATTFCYQMIESIDDIKATTGFNFAKIQDAAFLEAKNKDYLLLQKFNDLQLKITEELINDEITFDDWSIRDEKYQATLDRVFQRLDEDHYGFRSYPSRLIMDNVYVKLPERNYNSINMGLKLEYKIRRVEERLQRIRNYRKYTDESLRSTFSATSKKMKNISKVEKRLQRHLSKNVLATAAAGISTTSTTTSITTSSCSNDQDELPVAEVDDKEGEETCE